MGSIGFYTGDTGSCTKCGGRKINKQYIWPRSSDYRLGTGPFMKRECADCGFAWKEMTRDGEG